MSEGNVNVDCTKTDKNGADLLEILNEKMSVARLASDAAAEILDEGAGTDYAGKGLRISIFDLGNIVDEVIEHYSNQN